MTPSKISREVVAERAQWIRDMLKEIGQLPSDRENFLRERRNVAAAESFLRRALEALLDLGRHILAKGFGEAVGEHKEIGKKLEERGVLKGENAKRLVTMAGYRNRLVHFYFEVSPEELYEICTEHLHEVESVLDEILRWLKEHPAMLDQR